MTVETRPHDPFPDGRPLDGAPEPAPARPAAGRLREHLRVPLFRNAYALIGSTFLMTGLGLLASIAAAHVYSDEDFGRGQSAVHALILLSGLGNLRLMNVLTRFLPRARERSGWLVNRCYLLATAASVVACVVYLTALQGALPIEKLMGDTPHAGLWLTIAVVAFALFTVQDAVLTGLREATWVPVKNGIHGAAKLILVVALAGALPATGILASWAIPTLLALVPVNLLIARRLLPANAHRNVEREDLSPRRLAPFAAGEYAGSLCELAVANLIPLVILARMGPEAAGAFAVAWLIGTTLDHIVMHFGSSLTVEGSSDPQRLPALIRTLLQRSALVIGPISAAVVLGAPLLLLPFGSDRAAEAGNLLRLLGLALLPRLVCIVAIVIARVHNDVPRVVGIQALLAAGTLVGTFTLLGPMGIAGPGLAYLTASVATALAVAPRVLATIRAGSPSATAPAGPFDAPGNPSPDPSLQPSPALSALPDPATMAVTDAESRALPPWRPPWVTSSTAPSPVPAARREFVVPAALPKTRPSPTPPLPGPDGPRHLASSPRRNGHHGERNGADVRRPRGWRPTARRVLAGHKPTYLQLIPLGASLLLATVAFAQTDRTDAGGALGLAAVLPVTWWLAAALLTAGFTWLLVAGPAAGPRAGAGAVSARSWALGAYLVALVVLLHATPGIVAAHGRFPTAWTHVGFVDHIVETGGVEPGYDGRYNWPGALSFGAFLTELTGAESARALLRFAPVLVNLLLLVAVALIARHVTKDQRLRWMMLWLFVVTNWVGQDYLAPQAVALLAYLVIMGVLLRWFRWAGLKAVSSLDLLARARQRFPRLTRDDRLVQVTAPPPPARAAQEFGLVVALTALGAVLAFSHQLTPFMLVIAAALLVVVGRVDRPSVPLLLGACAVAWTAFGTTSFLSSNLDDLVSGIGNVGGVVDDNQGRVGPDATRQLVLAVRFLITGAAVTLAAAGLWRQWRARRADWGVVSLALAPFTLMVLNNYGGEIILRISLFALPFLAALGAFAFLREDSSPRSARVGGVAFFTVTTLLVPLFTIARYGNEAYERIYTDDIAAWDYVVDHAPPGATVVVPDFAGPWRYHSLMRLEYRLHADERSDPLEAESLDELVASDGLPGYLILGTASREHRRIAEGYPPTWQDDLVDELLATRNYQVVFRSGDTRVLERS